jgi:hypothetical protein
MTPFTASRDDGRSDRQVVYDLTHTAEPGATYTYKELTDALAEGLDQDVDRGRIYRAVASANKTLLREHSRYLGVILNVGYRVLRADEHLPASIRRKDRGQAQFKRGLELLAHTRLGELDQAQRKLHEAQRMILSGICTALDDSARRHDRSEGLIEDLLKSNRDIAERLEKLENQE